MMYEFLIKNLRFNNIYLLIIVTILICHVYLNVCQTNGTIKKLKCVSFFLQK